VANDFKISESSEFAPQNPYGVSKLNAYHAAKNYRKDFDIFVANAILFNHESPLRGEGFVSRRISQGVARIALGSNSTLEIGSLEPLRDWGYAPEYVEGMWLMLQHSQPEDFVLATGSTSSIRQFISACFSHIGIEIIFSGEGVNETGLCSKSGRVLVQTDPLFRRSTQSRGLAGDATKAKEKLGWFPSFGLHEISKVMIESEIRRLRN
jgi:GDPmannose 4,6-dehydratase